MHLDGTTSFITGAAHGIGLGIARSLARQGSRLALADLDRPALGAAAAELAELTQVEAFELDVRDRDAYARVADEAEARLGPVSVLCNNAGIAFSEVLDDTTYRLWDLVLGINLGGVVNGVQTFLPRMLDRGAPAHIVNTASAAGLIGAGVGCMYTTSKFAVVGLSESLRHQLGTAGHPVGVTVLCPGGVSTNLARTARSLVGAEPGVGARVERTAPQIEAMLQRHGADPGAVGDQVVDAIRNDRLYVLTDRAGIDLVTRRTDAILAAMPADGRTDAGLDDLRRAAREVP